LDIVRWRCAHVAQDVDKGIQADDASHDLEHRLQARELAFDSQRSVVVANAFETARLERIVERSLCQLAAEWRKRRRIGGDPSPAPENNSFRLEIGDASDFEGFGREHVTARPRANGRCALASSIRRAAIIAAPRAFRRADCVF
jgi:hypothetical protein